MLILIAEFVAEVLALQDKSSCKAVVLVACKNFVSSSVNEYNV